MRLYLDDSAATFFRVQGPGWRARVNRVLATYAQLKIADVKVGAALVAEVKAERRACTMIGGDAWRARTLR